MFFTRLYSFHAFVSFNPVKPKIIFQTTQIDESETRLLHQSFMLNPSQTVYEYVTGHGAKIVDFFRTEIGEYANKSG